MSMMRAKKHPGLAQSMMLGVLMIIAIASPLSVPFGTHGSFGFNVASAQASTPNPCGLGDARTVLPDGKIQCSNGLSTVIYNSDGSRVATLQDGTTIATDKAGSSTVARATSCATVAAYAVNLGDCLVRSFVSFTTGSLIYMSTWVLAAAASLFNWVTDKTIIQFGAFYQATIKTAVETAWTAFRDIANIFIIGIFTFVAISIILGLKEFGQKRMIASVLIVAVLLNFSLLFTKIVIDASNFAAAQIYTAAALGSSTGTQGAAVGSATTATKYGIAEQFMYLLGVGTFADARKLVDDTAEAKDSGWVALLHGILVMLVVLGAALVLFYGSFLLVSRMIMLIFLLVTAAIAVASYLIPEWGGSSYGFKAWKSSLIWAAAFAPMLMILLWMTLNVSYAIKGTSKATLGAALSNPTGGENTAALFTYVLVLGLLFATFKLSSKWANKIGGFSWAAFLPALGVGIGARVAAFAGRQTFGRAGMYVGDKLQSKAKATDNAAARRLYDFGAQRFKSVGKRDFNLMRTPLGTDMQKIAGIKKLDTLAGKDLKGFEGVQKEFIKRTGEQARRMEYGEDEIKKIREEALNAQLKADPELAQRHAEAEQNVKTAKGEVDVHKDTQKEMQEQFAGIMKGMQDELVKARQTAATATPANKQSAQEEVNRAQDRVDREKRRQDTEMKKQADRIKEAQQLTDRAQKGQEKVIEDLKEAAIASGKMPRDFKKAGAIAEDLVKTDFTATLFRATGISKKGNEELAKKAGKEAGKQQKQNKLKETGILDALKDLGKEEDHAAPAAPEKPAPSSGGGSGGGGGHK